MPQRDSTKKQTNGRAVRKLLVIFIVAASITYLGRSVYGLEQHVETLTCLTTDLSAKVDGLSQEVSDARVDISKSSLQIDNISEIIQSREVYSNTITLSDFEAVLADAYDRTVEEQTELYADDRNYSDFYGRFYVPDAKIDVALYYGLSQAATDRQDSAAIFAWENYYGELIADHNNQEFSKLFSVEVGTEGYIQLASGDIISIVCVDVFNGHNTGDLITDEAYTPVHGRTDYLTYTCRNGWQNIRICLWNKI